MKRFLIKTIRFAITGVIAFLMLIGSYFILDPFKVIYQYDRFVENNAKSYIVLNQDYVSTKTFETKYKSKKYNSFIFGNSRSIFYQISDWKLYIGQNSNCFHFDASDESLYALHKKIIYINGKKVNIDNVLLILDNNILNQEKPRNGPLFEISPQLVNNDNFTSFHLTYFKAFCTPSFLFPATYFIITNKVPPFMKSALDARPRSYDPITNELQFDEYERMINEGKYYTKERAIVFYERDTIQEYTPPSIKSPQVLMLKDIYDIFKKNNTNYKIIISPLYDQVKLNPNDLKFLEDLFGKKNVFDFSGINKFTSDYKNYYETSHYRPHVARELLKIVYE